MTMIPIRLAQLSDEEGVLALAQSLATSFIVEPAAFHQAFEEIIASPHATLLLAETESRIVGYVLGYFHPAFYANGRVGWVEEMIVQEHYRRQGIGRALIERFETWAHEKECKLIALATRRASEFYLALGYEESAMYFRKVL